jgi:hypothetical protein
MKVKIISIDDFETLFLWFHLRYDDLLLMHVESCTLREYIPEKMLYNTGTTQLAEEVVY